MDIPNLVRGLSYLDAARLILEGSPLKDQAMKMLEHVRERTELYPASTKYHHVWPGGLADHITQMMMIAWQLKSACPDAQPHEIVVAVYLHDWEKHFKYEPIAGLHGPELAIAWDSDKRIRPIFKYIEYPRKVGPSYEIMMGMLIQRFGIPITMRLSNALMMCEGGYSVHAGKPNAQMGPLAAVIHSADLISSHSFHELTGHGAAKWESASIADIEHVHINKVGKTGDDTWPR